MQRPPDLGLQIVCTDALYVAGPGADDVPPVVEQRDSEGAPVLGPPPP